MMNVTSLSRYRPDAFTAAIWATILFFEAVLLVVYLQLMNAQLLPFHVYPFVWINLSLWVFWRISPPEASARTKRIGAAVAGVYFLVLAYFGGFLREGHRFHAHGDVPVEQLAVGADLLFQIPPGYGPAFTYSGEWVVAAISPYLLVGFLALTYLMYVTVLDASGEAAVGVVGVFSCVGCSFPLITALVSGGATTTVTAFIYSQAYALSTVVFTLTVLFLAWRPFKTNSVRTVLLTLGLAFVLVSATVHLWLGTTGILGVGTTEVALSVLFLVIAALSALLVGGYATRRLPRVPTLALSAGLMALVFVLYFDWHLFGVAETLLPLDAVGLEHGHDHHDHGESHSALAQVGALLRDDSFALLSKSAEFLAALFLGLVAVQEWVDSDRI